MKDGGTSGSPTEPCRLGQTRPLREKLQQQQGGRLARLGGWAVDVGIGRGGSPVVGGMANGRWLAVWGDVHDKKRGVKEIMNNNIYEYINQIRTKYGL